MNGEPRLKATPFNQLKLSLESGHASHSFDYIIILKDLLNNEIVALNFFAFEKLCLSGDTFFSKPKDIDILKIDKTKDFRTDLLSWPLLRKNININFADFLSELMQEIVEQHGIYKRDNFHENFFSVFFNTKPFFKDFKFKSGKKMEVSRMNNLRYTLLFAKTQKELCSLLVQYSLLQNFKNAAKRYTFDIYGKFEDARTFEAATELVKPINNLEYLVNLRKALLKR